MAKAKSKRQLVRDERRKKKRDHEQINDDDRAAKRQRRGEGDSQADGADSSNGNGLFFEDNGGDPMMTDGGHGHSRGSDNVNGFGGSGSHGTAGPEFEFFGMLSEEEQEYFRRADELLELNDFGGDSEGRHGGSADEERRLFLASVFREARGKELKLASSQSCSRLMERLVQVASRRQLRHLFAAFSGHYATLVTHRFASHCCEQLFLQAAQWVGRDEEEDNEEDGDEEEDAEDDPPSVASLYLFVLDELEPHLTALLTDRFASHTLRVLLVVLSGRPQDAPATRSLLRSKNKETVRVGHGAPDDKPTPPPHQQPSSPPPDFTRAVRKILADVAANIDAPSLRVLATHPTGNPVLQLLVELEMADAKTRREAKKGDDENENDDTSAGPSLVDLLLPGSPASLLDPASPASDLLRALIYDPIGSRLLETLVVHGPAKMFKALYAGMFAGSASAAKADSASATPMAVYLRNDIACYPAMRVVERLGRDDLTQLVQRQILGPEETATTMTVTPTTTGLRRTTTPLVTQLVHRRRFHVLRTLLERCGARAVDAAVVQALVRALETAAAARRDQGGDPARLVTVLCWGEGGPAEEAGADEGDAPPVRPPARASGKPTTTTTTFGTPDVPPTDTHGCLLLAAMLALPGAPAAAVETALRALDGDQLARLATGSPAGARVLVAALAAAAGTAADDGKNANPRRKFYGSGPPVVPLNKQLVAGLVPHTQVLATSPAGHAVLVAIVQTPSRAAASPGTASSSSTGSSLSLPFHLKDTLITQLAAHEDALRACWPGRAVWRAWRGDLWRQRRSDWVHFAKAGEPEGLRVALAPVATPSTGKAKQAKGGARKTGANAVSTKTPASSVNAKWADKADTEEHTEAATTEEPAEAVVAETIADEDDAAAAEPATADTDAEEQARREKREAGKARRLQEKLAKKERKEKEKANRPNMSLKAMKEKRARKKLEKREQQEMKEAMAKSAKKEKRENKYIKEKKKRAKAAGAASA